MPTQTTDAFFPSNSVITYAGPSISWTVDTDVLVNSGSVSAIVSKFSQSKLVNKGNIYSFANTGVSFFSSANGSTIKNKDGATIYGNLSGIFIGAPSSKNTKVENDGKIVGYQNNGIESFDTSNFQLINTGEIFGGSNGVNIFHNTPGLPVGATIENAGRIHSDQVGLRLSALAETTNITNKKKGVIEGDPFAIFTSGTNGGIDLANKGKIKGHVGSNGLGAKDKVVNEGKIKGDVILGTGKDVYKNDGGKAGKVFAGGGNDKLTAGKSKDQFVFNSVPNAVTNLDRIKEFESGKDKLLLDISFFASLTGPGDLKGSEFRKAKNAKDNDDYILYHKKSGALYYDFNADSAGGKVQIAKLDAGQNLKASDFEVIA